MPTTEFVYNYRTRRVSVSTVLAHRLEGQNKSRADAELEDAFFLCLARKLDVRPGELREIGNPDRAYDSKSGRNFAWDKDKKRWIDTKQLDDLIEELQKTSEGIGSLNQNLESGETGEARSTHQEMLNRNQSTVRRIKSDIDNLFSSCCVKSRVATKTVGGSTYRWRDPYEVSVGYQFERAPDEPAKNLNGVNGQVFYNFNKHIGIGADFAWTVGSDRIGATTDVTLHRFTGLFGPRFNVTHTLNNGSGKDLIFHFPILIGFDHDSTKFRSSTISTSATSTAFMMSFGANLDVMLKKNFGVRPFDFAYQPTHFGGTWQPNWKLGAGIVFRFGEKK